MSDLVADNTSRDTNLRSPKLLPTLKKKTSGFLMFSGGIEKKHWPEVG